VLGDTDGQAILLGVVGLGGSWKPPALCVNWKHPSLAQALLGCLWVRREQRPRPRGEVLGLAQALRENQSRQCPHPCCLQCAKAVLS
jgi:hypothetical protein